jgi:hypothetical protein
MVSDNPKSSADHIYHVWMNSYADKKQSWPHSLYEFKSIVQFLEYGWKQIEKAYSGELPTVHNQCCHAPEPIPDNKLMCCLGKDVKSCEILVSIKTTFDEQRQRECGVLGKFYADVPDEFMYRSMAQTCAWHIFTTVTQAQEDWHGVDTSEGHLMDKGDRMFWQNVYRSMGEVDKLDQDEAAIAGMVEVKK